MVAEPCELAGPVLSIDDLRALLAMAYAQRDTAESTIAKLELLLPSAVDLAPGSA